MEDRKIIWYAVGQQQERRGTELNRKKWLISLFAAVLLCAGSLYFLWTTGFFKATASVEGIQRYIRSFAPYSQLVFFLIQLLSVILAPIPSNISAAAGGILFGPWVSFGLTIGAVQLGSVAVFALARKLGKPFVDRVVSQKVSRQYMDVIQSKQNVFLVLTFLFPFFPDDMICALAGLTNMPAAQFIIISLLTRPWGLLFASALGAAILNISWWWMTLIGVLGLALFLVGMKYGDRVEKWVMNKLKQE